MELLLIWLVMGAIVAMIASSKGRSAGAWFFYGVLVWPIALVHILLTPRPTAVADERVMATGDHRRCPYCAELVRKEAIVCRHCGRDIGPNEGAAPARVDDPPLPLQVGSRVSSQRFGAGTVREIAPLGITVEFDKAGPQMLPRGALRLIVEG
ncbi:zinc ribbon protein [Stella humosa]|uniref:Zinc ribbon protein n=1 Tax=Stella humosa TaxID=94 RepID=A0A3N1LZ31_9PROT|nr:zinc ribbon domain-containing protein [Stella humosa]ROQ00474.1 zinc ribbon protein [Stella humosa]BBK30281.1 hypothetical protein STHU_09150 [Stella humosa]